MKACLVFLLGFTCLVAEESKEENIGIANEFPGDLRIATHPSVVFADDFEGEGDFKQKWDEARDRNGAVLKRVDPRDQTGRLGNRCLEVTATLGENTGGGVTKWFASSPKVYIRFYTKFHSDCDYVHHFVTLRANKSLRGGDRWSGFGKAGLLPDGAGRFSTALEPWGNWGKNAPPGKWNFYSYWHEMKQSRDGKYWGNGFRPETQPDIVKDRWICCEFMLRHNTPGKPDGAQAYWIDGRKRGEWDGINWRTSPTLWANAITIESYITDRWTKNPTNIVYFDNVVIASEYIGPTVAKVD